MSGRFLRADLLGELNSLTHVGVVGNLSDAQLLDRFLTNGGESAESAFQALVTRHGPMVLGVCGNVLRDPHDAQDAFQATFLVLASRARSIRRHNALASWLLGVARRVAVRSRADVARRRVYERRAAETKADCEASPPDSWPELHEEIGRLPERYREPVVLCYLEGLSTDAAALRLGCPKGTVLSRLSRARDRLRLGLTRRGLALPTGLPTAGLSPQAAQVAIPPGLLNATVRASLKFLEQPGAAAGLASTTAVTLARGVIFTMMITKTKILAATVLAGVLTLGVLHTFARQLGGQGEPRKPAAAEPKADERQAALIRSQAAQRAFEMTAKDVSAGRLTDIEVLYRWSCRWRDGELAASKTKQERVDAALAHLKRMKDLETLPPAMAKVAENFPASSEAAATYYRLEAEAFLDQTQR